MAARRRLITALADVNRTRRPEHDLTLRLRILVAVAISILAVLLSGAAPVAEALVVMALLPVGFWWSHRQRASSNFVAKGLISAAALVVLARFFRGLVGIGTIDDARLPLTLMFLEIQVLHAFDLPQRRDLVFTLASSLALIGLAVSTGPGVWLLPVVLNYLVAAGASLQRYQRSVDTEWLERATREGQVVASAGGGASPRWRGLRHAAALMVVGALVFASVPLRADASLGGLPFEFGIGGPQQADGNGRVGGDLPFDQSDGEGSSEVDPVEYFGFAERVDPRSVGELSDIPVLRVRTNRPRPLRGVVFDLYADGVWGRTEVEPEPRQGLPIQLEELRGPAARVTRVTQTVQLLRPTPNLLFAAADPMEVWVAARSITPWADGTLTTGIDMTEGTVYSVVSAVDVTPLQVLRSQPFDYGDADPVALERWTALPSTVPQRVHDLATELALEASAQTPYAIAEAFQAHIGSTVSYNLGADPTPSTADPADHLLFESRQGWCEPIATAMVVLLRSVGIPARFVTGFQPGARQILSGQYVVRGSDAHAWVEVFIPDVGWTAMDPTGATTPVLDPEGEGSQVLLAQLAAWVAERVPRDPVLWAAVLVGLLLAASLSVAGVRWHRMTALRRAGPWVQLVARLQAEGLSPPASATPAEVVGRAVRALPHLDADALRTLQAYEEARRYTDVAPVRDTAQQALLRL